VDKFLKILQILGVLSFILYFIVAILYNSASWYNYIFGG
jgi:hypothetical protein